MNTRSLIASSLPLVLAAAMVGCESGPKPGAIPVSFGITPSQSSIVAGEVVTFTARAQNTYGRDVEVEWTTTGGEMQSVDGDRVQQVTFDEAGEYKVSADLLLEGKRVASDMEKVSVREVK